MRKNAIGITDEAELEKIAQEVPDSIKRKQCSLCLWAAAECYKGSLLKPSSDDKHCLAYTYYN